MVRPQCAASRGLRRFVWRSSVEPHVALSWSGILRACLPVAPRRCSPSLCSFRLSHRPVTCGKIGDNRRRSHSIPTVRLAHIRYKHCLIFKVFNWNSSLLLLFLLLHSQTYVRSVQNGCDLTRIVTVYFTVRVHTDVVAVRDIVCPIALWRAQ